MIKFDSFPLLELNNGLSYLLVNIYQNQFVKQALFNVILQLMSMKTLKSLYGTNIMLVF